MLLNRAAGTRGGSKVVSLEFTCNIILDYERDKLHSFDSIQLFKITLKFFLQNN